MKPETKKSWFVFYTKARHEKKVRDLLLRRGYEVFLPMQKVLRQWSDRKKKVEVPLFSSYIFVHVNPHQVGEVVEVPGISWAIRHNGKPAILQPRELELIKRFLQTGLAVEVLPSGSVKVGDKVQVVDGPLKGAFGQVTLDDPAKFTVSLDMLGHVMAVGLNPIVLKKV